VNRELFDQVIEDLEHLGYVKRIGKKLLVKKEFFDQIERTIPVFILYSLANNPRSVERFSRALWNDRDLEVVLYSTAISMVLADMSIEKKRLGIRDYNMFKKDYAEAVGSVVIKLLNMVAPEKERLLKSIRKAIMNALS